MSSTSNRPKKLYMADSLETLNSKVDLQASTFDSLSKKPIDKLIKSADKILGEATNAANTRDEELAYLYYMRYFSIIQCIQSQKAYKDEKKHYDMLLKPTIARNIINKAESLGRSLRERYEEERAKKELKSDKVKAEVKIFKKETEEKSNSIKTFATITPKEPVKVEKDAFITCEKLLSLTKEKVSSFLVVDVRPKSYFEQSSLYLSSYIHFPEDMLLKKGFTPEKIGKNLEENSRLLWNRRGSYDFIIICDEATDSVPFPAPIANLLDSMQNWDPGKNYKAAPVVLKGGLELLRCTYPYLSSNPNFEPAKLHAINLEDACDSILSFEFPNLNVDSNTTKPTLPDNGPSDVKFEYPKVASVQNIEVMPPNFNRSLKPATSNEAEEPLKIFQENKENIFNSLHNQSKFIPNTTNKTNAVFMESISSLEGPNNNDTLSSFVQESEGPSNLASNENSRIKTVPGHSVNNSVSSSIPSVSSSIPSVSSSITSVPSSVPSVPSRSLKPRDLLDSFSAKEKDMDEEQHLLEETYKTEKESIRKLEEIEQTKEQQRVTSDEQSKLLLAKKEAQLMNDMTKITLENKTLIQNYEKLCKENDDLRRNFQYLLEQEDLRDRMNRHSINDTASSLKDNKENIEMMELKAAQEKEEQRKLMRQQVNQLRKKKNEMLNKMKKNEEREHKEQSQWAAERNSRNREHLRPHTSPDSPMITPPKNKTGDTYTTRFRSSPNSSPVRGSTMARSHSAVDLSRISLDSGISSPASFRITPSIDRTMKPLSSPRRQNVRAARQRNFEPKHGSVGFNKTGLKNLGNTCYMNSIIQCLSCTNQLARYFCHGAYSNDLNEKSPQRGDVAEEFAAVIKALWAGNFRTISMWDLKHTIGVCHKPFQGSDQHDAHEFLLKLMDWLHNDLNRVTMQFSRMKEQDFHNTSDHQAAQAVMEALAVRDKSVVRDLFYGLHRSVIVCGTCNNRSLTFEQFSVLTVSFPVNQKCTLKDMLQDYYKKSNIEYKCSKCNRMRNCTRSLNIWRFPPVLVIHLNRFEHDVLTKKKQNYVDFPLDDLDLSRYVADHNVNSTYFNLYGVSNHYGTIDGGHYTAFCKSPQSNCWYKFDDHEVYDLPRESVKTAAAYILFYESEQ